MYLRVNLSCNYNVLGTEMSPLRWNGSFALAISIRKDIAYMLSVSDAGTHGARAVP